MNEIYNFILLLLIIEIKSYYTIPFKLEEIPLNLDDETLIKTLFFNGALIKVKIGSLKEEISVKIKSTSQLTYIINSNTSSYQEKLFNSNKSSTLEITGKKKLHYNNQDINNGIYVKDNFIFENEKENKLNFILTDELSKNSHSKGSGAISLGKKTNSIYKPEFDFILTQLKNLNIINDETFTFHFTKKNEGNLIIGNYLYDIKQPLYLKEAFQEINCNKELEDYIYGISVDIKSGNNELDSNIIIFAHEFGLIIGSTNYYDLISKNFFDKFSKEKCENKLFEVDGIYPNIFNQHYYYYVCDKDININNFPSLIISNSEIDFNIEFTYQDLWFEYNNKKYFLVVFPKSDEFEHYMRFLFGNLFFKKYDVSFDADRKIVGFYDKNKKTNDKHFYWILLFFVILIGIFVYLIFLIKKYKKRFIKKKSAHELEEDGFFQIIK